MTSIKRRLIILLALTLSGAWFLTALLTLQETHDEINAIFDAQITQSAHILLGMARREKEEIIEHGNAEPPDEQSYEQTMLYQIWDQDGIVMRSINAPEYPILNTNKPGFFEINYQQQKWRLYSRWDTQHLYHILVAEPIETRTKLAHHIAQQILIPALIFFPILGLVIWFTVRIGLSPLQRIRQAISERNASRLDAIPFDHVPVEVLPLISSINDLLGRLKRSLDSEKQFTGNAAHELRTPLAAIKTQAQVAMRATQIEDRQHALEQVIQGTLRATHLIEQLLILARIDPDTAQNKMVKISLCDVIHKAKADLQPCADLRHIQLDCTCLNKLEVVGNPWQLEIVLRNLIDNAIRYSPEHSQVTLSLKEDKQAIYLAVTDQGPGIDPLEQSQIFQRFYRVPGTLAQGSGLGLSITQRIMELHHGEIKMNHAGMDGDFTVTLVFPKTH